MKYKIIAALFGFPCVVGWSASELTSDWGYQAEKALESVESPISSMCGIQSITY